MRKIVNVVGARPNFMKIAPLIRAMNARSDRVQHTLVHTGQHYDQQMSTTFFSDLGIPRPQVDLGVGSGTHAEQTGRVMIEFEKFCKTNRPDVVVVVGDVNSTLACAITAKKMGIAVAHVEAGLRSRDMSMPEEINRLCTDAISDYLFTTDHFANENLVAEGVSESRIHFVGNVMIDTLLAHREIAAKRPLGMQWGLHPGTYATLTLHRPSNVDDPTVLREILGAVADIGRKLPVVFPVHPRTRRCIESFGLLELTSTASRPEGLWLTEPLGYLDFLHLNMNAKMVLTDSGGLQEETTVLGVPCITLRYNTERPITCEVGTNILAGNRREDILRCANAVLQAVPQQRGMPERWDGRAAERIVDVLAGPVVG